MHLNISSLGLLFVLLEPTNIMRGFARKICLTGGCKPPKKETERKQWEDPSLKAKCTRNSWSQGEGRGKSGTRLREVKWWEIKE